MAENEDFSSEQEQIKRAIEDTLGYWTEALEELLHEDPKFMEQFKNVASHGHDGENLSPKVREYIHIGVYCMPPNFDENELRRHIQCAIDHGAEYEEILSIIKLISAIGSHSFVTGAPLLVDVHGEPEISASEKEKLEEVKQSFREKRGYWDDEMWGDVAQLDITWFIDYLDYTSGLMQSMEIERKNLELIALAVDASLGHTFEMGLKNHTEAALKNGATVAEIVEVFEIMTTMGVSTLNNGIPILEQEAKKAGIK